MNSKERVRAAFSHQEPDRVPMNYMFNPGIDKRLKEHFGLAADDAEGLRRALGIDFRFCEALYTGPRLHAEKEGMMVDPQYGIRMKWAENESGGYWDYCEFPLQDVDVKDVEAWPMPSPDDYDYEGFAAMLKEYPDKGIVIGGPGYADCMNMTGMLTGMEEVYAAMMTEEEYILRLIDRRLEIQLEKIRRELEIAQGQVDVFWIGEDLGTQHSPLISLEAYRNVLRPRHQKFVDLGKAYDAKVMIHSCGSSSWVFEDLIEMGVDVIDTLQPEAAHMAPEYLKSTFGDRLSFHGCISTAGALAYGTVEETVDVVKRTLEILKPGGGYALAPTHHIQDNSPTENVVAMYATAREFGVY